MNCTREIARICSPHITFFFFFALQDYATCASTIIRFTVRNQLKYLYETCRFVFLNKEKDPSLIWVHKNPRLKMRPHCGPQLFDVNEPSLPHIPVLITDEYLSYMKYRRTGRGNSMRLGKSYCHNHLATDNRNTSALICDHVSLLRNQVLYGLPWTRSVPDMSD